MKNLIKNLAVVLIASIISLNDPIEVDTVYYSYNSCTGQRTVNLIFNNGRSLRTYDLNVEEYYDGCITHYKNVR